MNTRVDISSKASGGSASAKESYLKIRKKQGVVQQISVLVDNGFNEDLPVLTPEEKKERKQLQKKLSVYKKRFEKAQENGKMKIMANNYEKIEEIQAKLDQPIRKESERRILDLTVSLVNWKRAKDLTAEERDWFDDIAQGFYKEEFGDLYIVTIASHYDQHSPHTHALIQLDQDLSIEEYLIQKYRLELEPQDADKKRDPRVGRAYRIIQEKWHDYVQDRITNELDTLKRGVKYHRLSQYKKSNPLNSTDNISSKENEQLSEEALKHEAQMSKLDHYLKVLDGEVELGENELESENTTSDIKNEENELKIDSLQSKNKKKPRSR